MAQGVNHLLEVLKELESLSQQELELLAQQTIDDVEALREKIKLMRKGVEK